jgi:predicted negative regulator of RcsB-dependent stress response
MKAQERHHLKQNEFAESVARIAALANANRDRLILVVAAVVLIGGIGGAFLMWQNRTRDLAGAEFAKAMTVAQAQIAPPPTVPGATQAPGTFPTVRARQEAALTAFQRVASTYPSSDDGIAAAYQAAATLVSLDRLPEAEKAYQDVTGRAGSSIYGAMARMGFAETLVAEKQFDRAIKEYTDLSAQRDGAVPVDSVLMQLARAYVKAGKTTEARAAFKRVVDEFPDSNYVADARLQVTTLSGN